MRELLAACIFSVLVLSTIASCVSLAEPEIWHQGGDSSSKDVVYFATESGIQEFRHPKIVVERSSQVDTERSFEKLLRVVSASEILAKIQNGTPVEYDHVIVRGDLDLSKLDLPIKHVDRTTDEIYYSHLSETQKVITSPVRIEDSEFGGVVDFSNSYFNETITFNNSIFIGGARFESSTFCGDAFFGGSTFIDIANFGSNFNGIADFNGSIFDNITFFGGSNFNGIAYFVTSVFNGETIFRNSVFQGDAHFENSAFNGRSIHFKVDGEDAVLSVNTHFDDSVFKGNAYFENATFNSEFTIFDKSTFQSEAHFENVAFNSEYTGFRKSAFQSEAHFENSTFQEEPYFGSTSFKAKVLGYTDQFQP